MNWLFDLIDINTPRLEEPKVDCQNCRLSLPLKRKGEYSTESKCCEFSPFWSSFGVGGWLSAGNTFDSLQALNSKQIILTKIGILHSVDHRLGVENLCHHFDKSSKACSIWSNRPPTCYTFYCASGYKNGLAEYSKLEDWLLSVESTAIQAFFKKEGISGEVWNKWAEYMEPEPHPETFPEELLLNDPSEAEKLYLDSYLWLRDSDDCALLRGQIQASWKKRFSYHPYFGNLSQPVD